MAPTRKRLKGKSKDPAIVRLWMRVKKQARGQTCGATAQEGQKGCADKVAIARMIGVDTS